MTGYLTLTAGGKGCGWKQVVWKGCLEEAMFKPDQLGEWGVYSKLRDG